jgi:hypothetical protein
MTDISGGAVTAAVDLSIGNDACTDTRPDFDKNKMIYAYPLAGVLLT